eukprot:TRINITY_DN13617_c0_g1_i2.p1 TRINITY_DN13617_c0_g1~~TRINITY_DN13617_c0_g1_i2.p1  ORF type:complete len:147 (+),score=23.11 TRINITY_DN13617_c0_g1_i2:115-555(+)
MCIRDSINAEYGVHKTCYMQATHVDDEPADQTLLSIPAEVLCRIFESCTGDALGRALTSTKDWGAGIDKQAVWKRACVLRGWESVGGSPSWGMVFKDAYCKKHQICMHCWKSGQGGHHPTVAGTRPICTWLVRTAPPLVTAQVAVS